MADSESSLLDKLPDEVEDIDDIDRVKKAVYYFDQKEWQWKKEP